MLLVIRSVKAVVITGLFGFSALYSLEAWAKSGASERLEKKAKTKSSSEQGMMGHAVRTTKTEILEEDWARKCLFGLKAETVQQEVAATSVHNLEQVRIALNQSQLQFEAQPVVQYFRYEEAGVELAAGFFVDCKAQIPANLEKFEVESTKIATATVHATPEESGATHQEIHVWIQEKGREIIGAPLEVYEEGPYIDVSKKVRMKIIYPIDSVSMKKK